MCGLVTGALPSAERLAPSALKRIEDVIPRRGPDCFGYAMVNPNSGATRTWTEAQPERSSERLKHLVKHRRMEKPE